MKKAILLGVLTFIISYLILVAIMLCQFILIYKEEIFENSLDAVSIIKLLFFEAITLSPPLLPFVCFATGAIFCHSYMRRTNGEIIPLLKKSLLPISIVCCLIFSENTFFLPKVNLHQLGLLFDVRSKRPEDKLQRTSFTLFKDSPECNNYYELNTLADSITASQKVIGTNIGERYMDNSSAKIDRIRVIQSKMLSLPFALFLLTYCGMFMGYLIRKWKYPALALIPILLIGLPAHYRIYAYLNSLALQHTFSPISVQLIYLIALSIIAFILFKLVH